MFVRPFSGWVVGWLGRCEPVGLVVACQMCPCNCACVCSVYVPSVCVPPAVTHEQVCACVVLVREALPQTDQGSSQLTSVS